jgi:hypothetical protein
MSHGAVNEDAESSERERGAWTVVAWSERDRSGNHIGPRARLSLRQAYRYVERARTIARALPVGEPSVPATFKIPRDVLAQLRAYSASSGLSLSAIVTRALKRCLTSTRQRRRHG